MRALLLLGLASATALAEPLDAARAALRGGRYAEVEKLARNAKPHDDAELLVARAELKLGRYAEAEKRLSAIVARAPQHHAARVELGRLYRVTGRASEAKAIWNRFFDDYEQGRVDKKSAPQVTAVAIAARYLGSYEDANATFGDAARADPKYQPVHVEWGETFLEKYAAGEAERDAQEAIKLDPADPDARWLLARVKIEQSYDVAAAEREIAAALKVNPHHAGALALRAQLAIENEEYDAGEKLARQVLSVNPKDEAAHTLLAAVRFLHDDAAGYQAEKRAVLAVNPRASGFFHRVAEFLVKQHRYGEANDLEREALKVDPDDPVALAAIGQNQLRLGDEQAGLAALQQAFARDAFNVRTYNLLNLFEEVIAREYDFVDAPPFRLRVPSSQKAVMAKVVPPMVAAEWKELTARYGFAPAGPLQIELYEDPQHYAVRTTGLPGLEALGVTFGKIVTGRSPAEGKFNWGMMLWHEIGHVFSIQLSKGRVPRWFTEGLSEYETERRNPDWRRHTHAALWAGLRDGKLLSVAQLNSGFVRARSVDSIVVAYHEAAEAVSFLIRRFGFPKAVEALKLYGAGKQTPEVIRAVTGLEVSAFDAAFQADLRARLAPYQGSFSLPSSEYADLDGLADEAKRKPDDARVQALYGMALLHVGHDRAAADAQVKKALKLGPTSREGLYAAAEVLLDFKQDQGALLLLEELIKQGGDGYDARIKLAQLFLRQGAPGQARAIQELNRAKAFDPESADPYELLAKTYLQANRDEDAIAEMAKAAHLDVHDASLARLLVEKLAARNRWAEVREAAAHLAWIEPFAPSTHLAAGRAALELKDPGTAIRELELSLLCGPKSQAPAKGLLARAYAATGDAARAKKLAQEALAEDPQNPDARAVVGAPKK